MIFSSEQSPVISLFSSTSSEPLQLFQTQRTSTETGSTSIRLVRDTDALPGHPSNKQSITSDPSSQGQRLNQVVLELISDIPKATYVQSPRVTLHKLFATRHGTRDQSNDLGLKLPWIYLQVRNIEREWSFEVGLADHSGRLGILRLSTFQKTPRLKASSSPNTPPVLHLPLTFPPQSTRPLTPWSIITLYLPAYIPYFSSSKLVPTHSPSVEDTRNQSRSMNISTPVSISTGPSGRYSHVAYVRVYAACRLRRIWFSGSGPEQRIPWEFELYGDG